MFAKQLYIGGGSNKKREKNRIFCCGSLENHSHFSENKKGRKRVRNIPTTAHIF
jgi:hypothetical protein